MTPIIISTANPLPTSAAYISTANTLPAGVPIPCNHKTVCPSVFCPPPLTPAIVGIQTIAAMVADCKDAFISAQLTNCKSDSAAYISTANFYLLVPPMSAQLTLYLLVPPISAQLTLYLLVLPISAQLTLYLLVPPISAQLTLYLLVLPISAQLTLYLLYIVPHISAQLIFYLLVPPISAQPTLRKPVSAAYISTVNP